MNKEIKGRIFSIIYMIVIVSFATWFVFGPREQLVYAAININNSKVVNKNIKINSKDILKLNKNTYNFSVNNKKNTEAEYEILLVNDYRKSILKDCKVLSNNYIKYSIIDENNYNANGNLRMDGIIYRNTIKPDETKEFSFKIWTDEKENKDICYYPMLKIEEK